MCERFVLNYISHIMANKMSSTLERFSAYESQGRIKGAIGAIATQDILYCFVMYFIYLSNLRVYSYQQILYTSGKEPKLPLMIRDLILDRVNNFELVLSFNYTV